MNVPIRPDGALASSKPERKVYVLDTASNPLPRIARGEADMLTSRGWAHWVGHGTKRHLRMDVDVPQRPPGRDGTRPIRGDGTCHHFGPGQLMGNPDFVREFIPTHRSGAGDG